MPSTRWCGVHYTVNHLDLVTYSLSSSVMFTPRGPFLLDGTREALLRCSRLSETLSCCAHVSGTIARHWPLDLHGRWQTLAGASHKCSQGRQHGFKPLECAQLSLIEHLVQHAAPPVPLPTVTKL